MIAAVAEACNFIKKIDSDTGVFLWIFAKFLRKASCYLFKFLCNYWCLFAFEPISIIQIKLTIRK